MEKQFYTVSIKDARQFAVFVQAESSSEAQAKALSYYEKNGPGADWKNNSEVSVVATGPLKNVSAEELAHDTGILK